MTQVCRYFNPTVLRKAKIVYNLAFLSAIGLSFTYIACTVDLSLDMLAYFSY